MKYYIFQGTISSDINEIAPFINSALLNIKEIIFDEEIIFDIKLILDELIVNGVLHGNKRNSCKYVSLNISLIDDSIVIQVIDEGDGIDFNFDDYDYSSLKTSGRGLILVRALSDRLILNNNEIIAIKNVSL